ncbi:MAG: hypothetical protein L0Y44_04235 [Phycisphaerales bacterium]|nr:hypothetical protein [Phycisphaerales bacterium]MCI0629847.1 hypothetical protein [Phycisphaerales bacterium]MCI0674858.1 hypothetical protein [Phycisphaerales bacterium]
MANTDDDHDKNIVADFIDHAAITDSNPPALAPTGEFLASGRSRIICECFDCI